jgi:hypothetical protein
MDLEWGERNKKHRTTGERGCGGGKRVMPAARLGEAAGLTSYMICRLDRYMM